MTNHDLYSDLAIAPGEYLTEVLEDLGMSQIELASRMGRPAQALNEIIKGQKTITPETAIQLERVTGVPAYLWTKLEEEYQLTLARGEEKKLLQAEIPLLDDSHFRLSLYREMAKNGWIKKTKDKLEKIKELWQFFGVTSLYNLKDVKAYNPAFRVSESGKLDQYAITAWLRQGEIKGQQKVREGRIKPFDKKKVKELLPSLRELTFETPDKFYPKLEKWLADCGIVFLVIPHLQKTFAQGATFWLSPDIVVIQVSLRYNWTDVFWFTFLHELGHVLLHGKRKTILSFDPKGKTNYESPDLRKQENEANEFARNLLIPLAKYKKFINYGDFTNHSIEVFSQKIKIPTGVVVGRLCHDKHIDHNQHTDLREQYEKTDFYNLANEF